MNMETNIVEILKDKPQGTKLYSSACGKCKLESVDDKSFKISFYNSKFGFMNGGEGYLDKNGKLYDDGECVVFPSKEMRDWSKFAWKKGDVLAGAFGVLCIFEKWANADYTKFDSKFVTQKNRGTTFETEDWYKVTNKAVIKQYISDIEEDNGGKLNLTTLVIEKPKKKPVFELGKLYVFNEEDEDGELTIIGNLIGKNESEDTLSFGNQYEIENEKFVTDQAFDLRISVHKELREATEGEAITFHEAYTIWEKSKKQSAFKPFDKVLVRDSESDKWRANLFGYIDNDGYYHCVYANWAYCIPYEGNEHLLGTTKDVEG
mgnify:FL=1